MKTGLLAFAFVALASVASAQSITDYSAKYYNVGAPAPVQTETFLAAAVSCNQVTPTNTNTVNPTRMYWDDPANVGKVCIYTPAAGAPLLSLPVGSFEGTLTANNAAGPSAESARVPFSKLAVPPVLTGLRFTR